VYVRNKRTGLLAEALTASSVHPIWCDPPGEGVRHQPDRAARDGFPRHARAVGKIDVIVSNAGNAGSISPLAEFPEDVFDEVLRVHVRGAFVACKYGIPQMNDGGSVIITSSVVGLRGDPGPYAYITAKHAQVGLMRSVAKEAAARRIRVNTIHPGPTRNTFHNQIEQKLSTV
jgi:NAD(P)-dependent dehydrogenase (short-subunit alcohol dehydrogenase family)